MMNHGQITINPGWAQRPLPNGNTRSSGSGRSPAIRNSFSHGDKSQLTYCEGCGSGVLRPNRSLVPGPVALHSTKARLHPEVPPLRIPRRPILAVSAALLFAVPAAVFAQAPAASVEGNRKALNQIFQDYWEDNLAHNPEFASMLGDKRFNDQIRDYSVKAYNDEPGPRAGLPHAPRGHRSRRAHRPGKDQPRTAAARA